MTDSQPSQMPNLKHGGRSNNKRSGFVLQRLGRRYARITSDVLRLRRDLQAELTAGGRRLDTLTRAKVQTICRMEASIRIGEKTLADNPAMEPEQVRGWRVAAAQWSGWRDRLLGELFSGKSAAGAGGVNWDVLSDPPPAG